MSTIEKQPSALRERIPVAVLAATGTVGQRFVSLLADHPWFKVQVVTASERSAGQRYADAAPWVVPGDVPSETADLIVQPTDDAGALGSEVRLVFSALPTEVAREVEPELAAAGYLLCTNASAMRMVPDVPLLIPDINPDHVYLIDAQREQRGWEGLIVASPNCSTTGVVFPFKALQDAFGLRRAHAVTMQAASGAGYPGVPSLDMLDNVVPYISGEEEKVENEPRKMLGQLVDGAIEMAEMTISAQTNRVPVVDGHLAAISVELGREASIPEVVEAMRTYQAPQAVRDLPTAPEYPIVVRDEPDRPQPRRDRDAGYGMVITVGRIQPCPVFDVKLVSLVHNTLRGAASGAILNAEWLVASGYLGDTLRADVALNSTRQMA
jgi:aspartate-semialdehyde dehydrogenase